jgi:2-polyprenyl-6-methoxyphenol hydroxylase-like FAD-dependent oxidoreductase
VRLYLGFGLDQPHRLSGPDGPAEFLRTFGNLTCVPGVDALAEATAVSPCATYANEDAWVDVPVADGVALIGDAAGWNDPITGQGLSITLRDVRVLSEILTTADDWSVAALTPYVDERRERMRRLRFGAQVQAAILNEFGDEARTRRARAFGRFAEDPSLMLPMLAGLVGPENVPPESFTEDTRQRVLA